MTFQATNSGTPSAIRQHYYGRKVKIYVVLIIITGLIMGFLGVERYLEFSEKRDIATQIDLIEDQLQSDSKKDRAELVALQEESNTKNLDITQQIQNVLPLGEQYTEMTRTLDAFFQSLNTLNNPIVATSLRFGRPRSDNEGDFSVLPFSMTIESSENNFFSFLDYVNSSGALSGNVRLMDIESIHMNLNKDLSAVDTIDFSVQMNAYFQNTTPATS